MIQKVKNGSGTSEFEGKSGRKCDGGGRQNKRSRKIGHASKDKCLKTLQEQILLINESTSVWFYNILV